MDYIEAQAVDAKALANLRAEAMKPSLVSLGRFDENRVRTRFLDTFVAQDTMKVIDHDELVGFYVVRERSDHLWLDHLYIKPQYQQKQLGKQVLDKIINQAKEQALSIRLGALKGSRSNEFYLENGFKPTHEDEFDIYYERI